MQYLLFWALRLKTQIPHRNCKNFNGLMSARGLWWWGLRRVRSRD